MKTELHKRQVRAEQVARTTNELVESLANCVSRRDTLVNRLVLETELHYLLKSLVKFFCQGHSGVSSRGVPGVPWHNQILVD